MGLNCVCVEGKSGKVAAGKEQSIGNKANEKALKRMNEK